jgi:hypothetical protein
VSHLLIYLARLQDAGYQELNLRLGVRKDRTRTMTVITPPSVFNVFSKPNVAPSTPRVFNLDGEDPVLRAVTDDLLYDSDDLPITPEAVALAIKDHPHLKIDIEEFAADANKALEAMKADPNPDDDPPTAEMEASVARLTERVKYMMKGMDMASKPVFVRSKPKGKPL